MCVSLCVCFLETSKNVKETSKSDDTMLVAEAMADSKAEGGAKAPLLKLPGTRLTPPYTLASSITCGEESINVSFAHIEVVEVCYI